MSKIPFLAVPLALLPFVALAQDEAPPDPNARWEKAIAKFESADEASPPPKDGFLFVGSSSIRMWKLDKSFPELGAINRGFGGSEIENSTHFAERIIIPHRPHTVLLYAGDNDINKGKSAERVIADFRAFVEKLREGLPDTHVAFIAIKPSLARWEIWPEMRKANEGVAAICAEDDKLTFLDIGKVTLGEDGKPNPDYFLEDGLHCSEAGYAAWVTVVSPYIEARQRQLRKPEAPAPEEAFAPPIDDRRVKTLFAEGLSQLLDAGETRPPKELLEQLESRSSFMSSLPVVAAADAQPKRTEVFERAQQGVLCLGNIYKCDRCDDWHGNIAGGFVISADGLAVTNYHVIETDRAAAYGAMDIKGQMHPIIEILAASKEDDLAIVRLGGDNFKALPLAEGALAGTDVMVISHPEGRFYTLSEGIISRYHRSMSRADKGRVRMSITAEYARGSSGSPVLDSNGAVVGVVASTHSIYYSKKDGIDRDLQMVIKSCIPTSAILKLIGAP